LTIQATAQLSDQVFSIDNVAPGITAVGAREALGVELRSKAPPQVSEFSHAFNGPYSMRWTSETPEIPVMQ
jgi:hypothetical protein